MIENQKQYKITTYWLNRFKDDLNNLVIGEDDSIFLNVYKKALQSQIEELEEELRNYKSMNDTIFEEIKQERIRQDNKFGKQPRNLKPSLWLAVLTEEVGEVARAILEGYSENYREELIQIAAVCTAAIEDFDKGNPYLQVEDVCKPIEYLGNKGV